MVNSLWNSIKSEISQSTNLSEVEIDSLSTQMLAFQSAQKVLEAGLVDKVCYADEVVSDLSNRLGVEESSLQSKLISVKDYVANMTINVEDVLQSSVKPKIAVLYADGEIDNGSNGITSSKIVKQLNDFREDENIFAVVLRVNSPGGSAYGAEQMWRAVERLKEKMPVIVSMGDYAASGGYYMSAGANRIFADEKTITGSIGVFSVIPNVKKLTDKLGVSYEEVSTNEKGGSLSLLRPLSPEEKQVLQAHVDEVYETFLKRCMDGREMSREAIAQVAEGRVWCGVDALSLGLVDEIGTLQDAIEYAAKLTKVEDNYGVDYYPRPKNVWEQWMEMTDASYEKIKESKFPLQYHLEKKTGFLDKVRHVDRIQAVLPYQIEPR
jgi:protease-4